MMNFFIFFLRPRDMGLAENPHRHPLQAAFCKHDLEQKFETNLKLIMMSSDESL
jgi:hypothetical protein